MKSKKKIKVVATLLLTVLFCLNLSISFFPNFEIKSGQDAFAYMPYGNGYDGGCDYCEGEYTQIRILCWEMAGSLCETMDCTASSGC